MRTLLATVMLCTVFMSLAKAQVQPSMNLMPAPAKVQLGSGWLLIDASFSVAITGHKEARLDRAVELFLRQLRRQTAMPPIDMKVTNSPTAALIIQSERGAPNGLPFERTVPCVT